MMELALGALAVAAVRFLAYFVIGLVVVMFAYHTCRDVYYDIIHTTTILDFERRSDAVRAVVSKMNTNPGYRFRFYFFGLCFMLFVPSYMFLYSVNYLPRFAA